MKYSFLIYYYIDQEMKFIVDKDESRKRMCK